MLRINESDTVYHVYQINIIQALIFLQNTINEIQAMLHTAKLNNTTTEKIIYWMYFNIIDKQNTEFPMTFPTTNKVFHDFSKC